MLFFGCFDILHNKNKRV